MSSLAVDASSSDYCDLESHENAPAAEQCYDTHDHMELVSNKIQAKDTKQLMIQSHRNSLLLVNVVVLLLLTSNIFFKSPETDYLAIGLQGVAAVTPKQSIAKIKSSLNNPDGAKGAESFVEYYDVEDFSFVGSDSVDNEKRTPVDAHRDEHEDLQLSKELQPYDIPDSPETLKPQKQERDEQEDSVIVVATVDGTIAGLSQATGHTLWKKSSSAFFTDTSRDTTSMKPHHKKHSTSGDEQTNEVKEDDFFAPLVSTSTTTTSSKQNSSSNGSKIHSDWRTSAVPSVDGRVYLTPGCRRDGTSAATSSCTSPNGKQETTSGEVTATTTVRDLVNRAPFVDARGRFYVGSRHATAAALDRDTGKLVRVVSGEYGAFSPKTDLGTFDQNDNSGLEERKIVWIGRVDYSVSVYDARTGEMDVKFSTSEVLSVNDMVMGRENNRHGNTSQGRIGAGAGRMDEGLEGDALKEMMEEYHEFEVGADGLPRLRNPLLTLPEGHHLRNRQTIREKDRKLLDSSTATTLQPKMIATPGGSVALRDSTTGMIMWVATETFDTPVAFALESSTGASLGVDIVPDAPIPNSKSKEYLSRELERQLAALDNERDMSHAEGYDSYESAAADETIVGALQSGQLFALPLGRGRNGRSTQSHFPYTTLGLSHPQTASSSSTMIGSAKKPHLAKVPQMTSYSHHPHGHVLGHSNNDLKLPLTSIHKRNCIPSSPSYPGCLVGSHLHTKGGVNWLSEPHEHDAASSAGAVLTNMLASGHLLYDETFADGHEKRRNRHERFRTFKHIMTSWIPPAVALAFVVSFELGRRERARIDNAVSGEQDVRLDRIDGTPVPSVPIVLTESQKSDNDREVGVIQVSDEVLGYGGHGTVVYKGKLEGRNVAVKRMLKAYHASADREISLMIESDGHPNVVRYFLKEIRGDFVYLALELCDMSLQDLIATISKHRAITTLARNNGIAQTAFADSCVDIATKMTLFQIASGVKHLHSLRIVHRDLKPANILLAFRLSSGDRRRQKLSTNDDTLERSVYAAFEREEYTPKISDMGLGKQLAGQSSFGVSTHGNGSACVAAAQADGSTIAGAGPGSVGWQAPEVMVQRWSPESSSYPNSVLPGENCPDSMMEASPIDACMKMRTSRSADIFSLGCIFYCTILPGSHPFGEWYEREANIMKYNPSTDALDKISIDASDLVRSMISRDPKSRPTAAQVCDHPFFWDSSKRLGFLCDLSDRLEADAVIASSLDGCVSSCSIDPLVIEKQASRVVGTAWDTRLDPDLLSNVARFRTYDTSSVRDCLRIIRNKHHHYDELPLDVRKRIGPNPDGLIQYFESKFPRLTMHCYNVCRNSLTTDDPLARKYGVPSFREPKVKEKDVGTPSISVIMEKEAETRVQKCYDLLADHRTSLASTIAEIDDEDYSVSSCLIVESIENIPHPPLIDTADEIEKGLCSSNPLDDSDIADCIRSQSPPSPTVTLSSDDAKSLRSKSPLNSSLNDDSAIPQEPSTRPEGSDSRDIIVWERSNAAKAFDCRGWMRSDSEWIRRGDVTLRKRDANIARCAEDPKFRTRLCNHWDVSLGTFCPMRKKNKCVFAHGPVELRVKEAKRNRWGKLVNEQGNNSNPFHSGGEDTYGAARSIESMRQTEGKWTSEKSPSGKGKQRGKQAFTKTKS